MGLAVPYTRPSQGTHHPSKGKAVHWDAVPKYVSFIEVKRNLLTLGVMGASTMQGDVGQQCRDSRVGHELGAAFYNAAVY